VKWESVVTSNLSCFVPEISSRHGSGKLMFAFVFTLQTAKTFTSYEYSVYKNSDIILHLRANNCNNLSTTRVEIYIVEQICIYSSSYSDNFFNYK